MMISDEPTLWAGKIPEGGTVWVVAPGLRRYAGPMSLVEYLNDRHHGPSPSLAPLLQYIRNAAKLPPFHLPQDGDVGGQPSALSHEKVAVAAYFRWLARGGESAPHAALDDWLTAERELLKE